MVILISAISKKKHAFTLELMGRWWCYIKMGHHSRTALTPEVSVIENDCSILARFF